METGTATHLTSVFTLSMSLFSVVRHSKTSLRSLSHITTANEEIHTLIRRSQTILAKLSPDSRVNHSGLLIPNGIDTVGSSSFYKLSRPYPNGDEKYSSIFALFLNLYLDSHETELCQSFGDVSSPP
jgi:hypothetical protein